MDGQVLCGADESTLKQVCLEKHISTFTISPLIHDQNDSTMANETVQPNSTEDDAFRPGVRVKLAFLALIVLTFMVAVNSTALAVALPVSYP